ncbi:hypothetical protein [Sphingobacterium gobiense]|uniref:Uncharacterized protein n=1 Tax=Sphingobacterium gobiense TaxID=1382456 RepID=A0A2S9JUC2_9SPHI|nr:hypothetical protein [Sphingobacterium gobiense]PRD56863.1 hypothetical protein C5749_06495 [Sphingobacterium gobiense]
MAYTKERKKLEKLLEKIAGLQNYDDKSLTTITDIYDQYSHTVRILKNKDAETFSELYLNELQQVKEFKRLLKVGEEEDRQVNFINYKTALSDALKKTIQAANSTI